MQATQLAPQTQRHWVKPKKDFKMTNAQYYVSNSNARPIATGATTLAGAKRAAVANCCFHGQTLWVEQKSPYNGRLFAVAVKRDNPINMSGRGKWEDVALPAEWFASNE